MLLNAKIRCVCFIKNRYVIKQMKGKLEHLDNISEPLPDFII